jgi:hypothetical protein
MSTLRRSTRPAAVVATAATAGILAPDPTRSRPGRKPKDSSHTNELGCIGTSAKTNVGNPLEPHYTQTDSSRDSSVSQLEACPRKPQSILERLLPLSLESDEDIGDNMSEFN